MFKINSQSVRAQGVRTETTPSCSISSFAKIACLILLAAFVFPQFVLAQGAGITWVDRTTYKIGYQFSSSNSTFQANEHISVNLYLETFSPTECFGGTFDLDLDPGVDFDPDSGYTVPETSNLGSSGEMNASWTYDATENEGSFNVHRVDSTDQSCSGIILKANLVIGASSINAEDVLQAFDGGIIMMENLDLKWGEETAAKLEEAVQVSVFPNPCTDWIQVTAEGEEQLVVKLRNLKGQVVWEENGAGGRRLDLQGLKAGMYVIEVRNTEGRLLHTGKIVRAE